MAATRRTDDDAQLRLGRLSYVSQRGLEGVLQDVRENGLPAASNRRSSYRAKKRWLAIGTHN